MIGKMIVHPDELSRKWIDKLVKVGVHGLGIHPVGGKRATQSLCDLVAMTKTPSFRALVDYARASGLTVAYPLHAAGYLMPRALFESHPEYFRMNAAGERTDDWNFCVSNPEALALFAERAATLAAALYGSDHRFHFWMDDGKDLRCHCPKCNALSASDQQMIAVHAMLTAIRREIPDAEMSYLAYYDTMECPTVLQPMEGVFLEYAPIEKYRADGDPEAEWKRLAPLLDVFGREGAEVLEYWYDNSLFSRWKKPPQPFAPDKAGMERDVLRYRALGFSRISTFACYLGYDYEALYGDVDIAPFADCLV